LANGFVEHLYTSLGATSNHSAIANLHIYKSQQHRLSLFPACCVSDSRSLTTASNSEDSSASVLTSLLSGEYPATELSSSQSDFQLSTELDCHFFSASLVELDSPAKPQLNSSESESESELLYDWRFTANQFVLASSPLRPTTTDIFFN
jgi:hypothetical protein